MQGVMLTLATVLIADDNKQVVSILTEYAKKAEHTVIAAYDGDEALDLFVKNNVDILLLDVMMPRRDGFEVCREVRRNSQVPIIMVTARGEDFERIMGLDIGADDYIVKPFSPGEVMARIRAVLRRLGEDDGGKEQLLAITIGSLTIHQRNYHTTIDGVKIALTKKETEVLWTLAGHPSRVFTRDNLLDIVWGYDYFGDNRTVDSHIKRLRTKLDAVPHPGWEIKTIWGVGYQLEAKHA